MKKLFDKYISEIEQKYSGKIITENTMEKDRMIRTLQELEISSEDEINEWFLLIGNAKAEISGFLLGMNLLNLEQMVKEWKSWREFDDEKESTRYSSYPVEAIQCKYSTPGWIPLCHDGSSNYIGVDLNPGKAGKRGQIINFGRDEDDKVVLFLSIKEMLSFFISLQEDMEIIECSDGRIFYLNEDRKHPIDWLKNILH